MHFFGVIRISGASWCIKGTDESSLVTDSSVPLMNHVSDLGSLIMIQITRPKERTQSVIIIDFRSILKHSSYVICTHVSNYRRNEEMIFPFKKKKIAVYIYIYLYA